MSCSEEELSARIKRAEHKLWHESTSAFCLSDSLDQFKSLSLNSRRSRGILKDITIKLPQTLRKCNPNFNYELNTNPKRVLTKPSEPVTNSGHDNINHDLIIHVNDIFEPDPPGLGPQYRVVDLLGQGTFGQVVKCINLSTQETVAVKVVKNKRAYYDQGIVELKIVQRLNQDFDPDDRGHIVRLKDYFKHHNHLCLVFELLSINLYELIKMNSHRGFSMNLLRIFLQQIIQAQVVLSKAQCIHCDLKPENILLCDLRSPQIKVIDFGSACYENRTVFSYIQSRFYRSPEVILGVPYTSAIDVWSIGCIAAELFFGLPLFPGNSEYNQISRIIEMFGAPPDWMLQQGKNTRKYFTVSLSITGANARSTGPLFQLKSEERYAKDSRTKVMPGKKYFTHPTLTENILQFPMKPNLSEEKKTSEINLRKCLAHFLSGLLQMDPMKRWTPKQALQHPFITEAPFDPNWAPVRPMPSTLSQAIPIVGGYHHSTSLPDSSFSPRSHFQFQLGSSPSTNYSPHSGTYISSNVHQTATSLPKDSYNNYYPPPGTSPMYMIPSMPHSSSYNAPSSGYNPPSFHIGGTPTSSFLPKSQQQHHYTPSQDNTRQFQPAKKSKSYRSHRARTQQTTPPYSPSRSLSNNPSMNSPLNSQTTTTPGNSISVNSHGGTIPPSDNSKKRTHRKMPSTGQFGLDSFEPHEPTFTTFNMGSGEPSPSASPLGKNSDSGDWDEQFYLEDDTSPVPTEKPSTSPAYSIPMRTPGNSFAPMDPNIMLGSSPSYNTYQSFSQGALSYNERTNGISYLDPSVFPLRKSDEYYQEPSSFSKKR